jgi:hypothetical protein
VPSRSSLTYRMSRLHKQIDSFEAPSS